MLNIFKRKPVPGSYDPLAAVLFNEASEFGTIPYHRAKEVVSIFGHQIELTFLQKYGDATDWELCDIDVGEFLEFIDCEVHMILHPKV